MPRVLLLAFLLMPLVMGCFGSGPGGLGNRRGVNDKEVAWRSIEEVEALMAKQPRKVLVDVYTDWCGWCKKLDETTYTDPTVIRYINTHFYAVRLDAEGKKALNFKGKEYQPQYNNQAAHELAVVLLDGQMGYPTTVFLDEKLQLIQPIPGYLDAPKMDKVLNYFGQNSYKETSWDQFTKTFQSVIAAPSSPATPPAPSHPTPREPIQRG